MGVLSLYKVFRNNTGQKKKREEKKKRKKEEKASIGEKEGRKRPIKEARDYSYKKEEIRGR